MPAPLQRLFDAVPLVTYGPNELPCRSPGPSDLPTLHVFITEHDAARGAPSFNPSCLKWQTFLRIAGVRFHLRPSTNHASPTGALPFLLPALSTIHPTTSTTTPKSNSQTISTDKSNARLDGRSTRPIPSTRLEAYAAQHGRLPPPTVTSQAPTPQLQSQSRRRQAYQSLLDGALRTAWLYTLYLSPANEPLLRRWYVDPASRSQLVRDALLRRVRAVAREEVAKSSAEGTTTDSKGGGWKISGNVGDLLSWALAGTATIDPDRIYADARRALGALETLLYPGAEGEADAQQPGGGGWFFGAPGPTLFDAAVFSYVYLILYGARASSDGDGGGGQQQHAGEAWGDDTLRRIVLECPRLVAHARRILDLCWGNVDDGEWVSLEH